MKCSDVLGYQRYGGPCCLNLHGERVVSLSPSMSR